MKDKMTLRESLERKVIAFYTDIWRDQRQSVYQRWLDNFKEDDEQLNALYLLSKFTYFGGIEIRALLKALYRDLYKYPIVESIRKENKDSLDDSFIKDQFRAHRYRTRFLGVGNPSESGVHLLYYFRQENSLSKDLFAHAHELFTANYSEQTERIEQSWDNPQINHIVFIDDFCGSGNQAVRYIKRLVEQIKTLNDKCWVEYFVLVANKTGLERVKSETIVDRAEAVFELDESFKCFGDVSRYFVSNPAEVDKASCRAICEKYGKERAKDAKSAMGYDDDELLLSFFHNTPNNTLPIFWTDDKEWYPIFNRTKKIY